MDKKVEEILNDLYMIDPTLKKQEKEVKKIVEELICVKPDIEVDERFVDELHHKLMGRIKFMKKEDSRSASRFARFGFAGKFAAALAVMVLVFAAVMGGFYYKGNPKNKIGEMASAPRIQRLQDNAFGSLAGGNYSFAPGLGGARGGGGGGNGNEASTEQSKDASMIAPEIVNYKYVYKGGDIDTQEKAMVYKRIKGFSSGGIMDSVRSLDLGLINFERFDNTSLSNVNFTENRKFGYEIGIDYREGAVSVYSGMNWPDPNAGCKDSQCYEDRRLKKSDVLKDEEAIGIANKFLEDYQIDRSGYGEPSVMNYGWFGQPAGSEEQYIPESLTVVYPLKINGQSVYDEAGNQNGMMVDVSVRYKKAYGGRNITSQKYDSSDYQAEQDKDRIISFAQNGGLYGGYMAMEATKIVTVELGTPKIQLISIWNYNQEKRTSDTLYVPAYVFPVTHIEDGYTFYRNTVIVPMPKEILDSSEQKLSGGVAETFLKAR